MVQTIATATLWTTVGTFFTLATLRNAAMTGVFERTNTLRHSSGRIKDPSAAMGLLWIRRNLAFQYQHYCNMFQMGLEPPEAALAAYHSELEPYLHGRALRLAQTMCAPSPLFRAEKQAVFAGQAQRVQPQHIYRNARGRTSLRAFMIPYDTISCLACSIF